MSKLDHVHFFKGSKGWVAQLFIDPNTCVQWKSVGARKNVNHIIKAQLVPAGIPHTIEDVV